MHVTRLKFKGYKGFGFDLQFQKIGAILISMNGGGKTTVLNMIAGLAGTHEATELVARQSIDWVEITLNHEGQNYHLRCEGWFDPGAIRAFKNSLPHRVSYMVGDEYWNPDFMTDLKPATYNVCRTFSWMESQYLIPLQVERIGYGSEMFFGAAVEKALRHGMRHSNEVCPALVDCPEGSYANNIRHHLYDLYGTVGQQLIVTTHCPSTMTGFESAGLPAIDLKAKSI